MALGKRLINTGGVSACTTDSADVFGDSSGVALYNLDYDASEASGTYDGTPTNVTFGVGGKINYGARFNGSSSKITAPSLLSSSYAGSVSYSAWFKTSNTANTIKTIIVTDDTTGGISGKVLLLAVSYSGGTSGLLELTGYNFPTFTLFGTTNVADGNWHNVVLVLDNPNATLKVYLDGDYSSPEITKALSSSNITLDKVFSEDWTIGSQGAIRFFDGSIDQVRIFNKALNQTEVDTLFAETACVYTATTTDNYYPLADGSSDAVAYYKLDNSSEDYVGSNDGTDTNIEYRFGRYGQAAVFNGSSSYINTTIPASVFNTNTWSISLWIKHTDTDFGYFAGTTSGITVGNGMGIALYGDGTRFDFVFRNGTTTVSRFQGGTLAINTWSNIVIVSDNNSVSFYQDSSLMSAYSPTQFNQNPLNVSSFAHSQPLYIGRTGTNTNDTWGGKIDQVRIYSTALSASQVTELYNEKPETDTSTFKTVLYEGTSAKQYISNVGYNLDVDNGGDGGFVWVKARTGTARDSRNYDTVRGIYPLYSSRDLAEGVVFPIEYDANGFFFNGNEGGVNETGVDYVAWVWKGGGDAVSNTDGTNITSQVSANVDGGFSIVTYTGATGSVGHGLDSTPQIIIQKRLDTPEDWYTYIPPGIIDGTSNYYYLLLNGTDAKATTGSTPPTSTTFNPVSTSGGNYVAYCFHSASGVSKIGSYTGDGTTSGKIIYTTDDGTSSGSNGFEPSFLLTKPVGPSGGYWYLLDNRRSTTNPRNDALFPNDNLAEIESTNYNVDFLSNGFELKNNTIGYNTNNEDYIYMAFK